MPDQLTFTPDGFDRQFIDLLDNLETQIKEVDFTSTPEYLFRKAVWAILLQKYGRDNITNSAWTMTVEISGLDMSRENDKNKLRYFAGRWANIVIEAIERLRKNPDIPQSAYESALSNVNFKYCV